MALVRFEPSEDQADVGLAALDQMHRIPRNGFLRFYCQPRSAQHRLYSSPAGDVVPVEDGPHLVEVSYTRIAVVREIDPRIAQFLRITPDGRGGWEREALKIGYRGETFALDPSACEFWKEEEKR